MSEAFTGEIRCFGFNFAPIDWAYCNGALQSIAQNPALYSLIGTIYGGDGQTTFGLPNLSNSVAMGQGQGPGLSPRTLGERVGTTAVTLLGTQIPQHTHIANAATSSNPTDEAKTPSNSTLIGTSTFAQAYDKTSGDPLNAPFAPNAIATQGSGQPHNNVQPLQALNFCICLYGIYPSRN